jgi:hypothetical protein
VAYEIQTWKAREERAVDDGSEATGGEGAADNRGMRRDAGRGARTPTCVDRCPGQ